MDLIDRHKNVSRRLRASDGCILKTGPKDAGIQGEERKKIFAGHFTNIGRLADEGKLAVADLLERAISRIAVSTSST